MKFVKTLITMYSLFVVLWFAAYFIAPDQWWPLIMLNKLAFFFLVVAIPVFIVALIGRNLRTAGLALLPVVVNRIDHIDYIWYAGSIRPMGLYRSIEAGGSDHAPVFADFFIN